MPFWSAARRSRDDDPELTCRLPGLFDRSPVRVILSKSLDVPANAKLVRTAGDVPVWIFTEASADPARRSEIASHGAEIIDVTVVG